MQAVNAVLDAHPEIARYAPLEHAAVAVAGGARSPYAAALALEAWFRVGGGFTYTSHPAVFPDAPLVGFVAQTRAGYCQYFAGAMALMLRYLGVPARVAVGFSSGTYDAKTGVWTVTDHDAHAWVEAWFRGFGWLPFDPTPAAGRPEQGVLSAPYSAAARSVASQRRLGGGGPAAAAAPAQSAHRHGEAGAARSRRGARARPPPRGVARARQPARAAGARARRRAGRHRGDEARAPPRALLSRDPRRVAAACRRELADFLLDQRLDAARSATLHELGALVRDELTVDPDAVRRRGDRRALRPAGGGGRRRAPGAEGAARAPAPPAHAADAARARPRPALAPLPRLRPMSSRQT